MLAEKGVDYAVILAEDTPAVTGVADNRRVADFCKGHPRLLPFCTFDPLEGEGYARTAAAAGGGGLPGRELLPPIISSIPTIP